MIRNSLVALLCLATIVAIAATEGPKPAPGSPEKFVADWAAAFNENDPEKHFAFYLDSEKTEMIGSSGKRWVGGAAIREDYQVAKEQLHFFDSKTVGLTINDLGDTALASFEHLFKWRVLADQSEWQLHIRTTMVLKKVDSSWKIVLEHSSPIIDIPRKAALKK